MEYERRGSGFGEAMTTLGAMVFGAAIGAAIALLMAPKPGTELRAELKEGASRMGERLSDASQDVVESMRTKVSQIGREVESMADRAQRVAEDVSEGSTGV